jgi:hypothetical protein
MTNNQRLAGDARELQRSARKHMVSIKGAGSAAVQLGGGATPGDAALTADGSRCPAGRRGRGV